MKPALGLGQWSIIINDGRWRPRNFDVLIIELLNYAMQGKVSKILLGVPSRHGKSTLISRNFCSYFLTHFPEEKIILSSYSQSLAQTFGNDVKEIVNMYGHLAPIPVSLSTNSRAASKFQINTPHTGQMLSVGAAGSILGFGAGLFIIDDPIKNVAEAESVVLQEKLRNWFVGTAKTRLEKRSNGLPPIMIIIAQRLHLQDLHGIVRETEPTIDYLEAIDLLRNGESINPNVWVDLNLPAVCEYPEIDPLHRERGEVLWEEQRDYDWLMAEKESMGSYWFNAIYQGNPQERDGDIFTREMFYDDKGYLKVVKDISLVPQDIPKLRYWDLAANSTTRGGDETCGFLTGYDGTDLYVFRPVVGNFSPVQVNSHFIKTCLKDTKRVVIRIEEEPGSGSRLLINKFQHSNELRGYNIRGDKVRYNKVIRSHDLEVLAETGHIHFVSDGLGDKWIEETINQLISFTGVEGKHDDRVDSLTGSARYWLRPKTKIRI